MIKPLRRFAALIALLVCAGALPAGAAGVGRADIEQARGTVDGFHAVLLEIMKNAESLGVQGRFARIAPEVAERFDSQAMIALATGRHWRGADKGQRERLVAAFRRMSAATYAARFAGYSGQKFELLSADPGPRGTIIVRTRIVEPDAKPVPLGYVLRKSAAGWRIVDVLAESGISELAVRRSEYRSVLRSGGVAALVASLESKATALLGP